MKIEFSKMQGLGNDFVVIDATSHPVEIRAEQIKRWADRHFGIGFDQLLLVEKPQSETAEFKYRIFNADGSEVNQCGNGARCFARFVYDKKLTHNKQIRVDTNSGQLVLNLTDDGLVSVNMGKPCFDPKIIPLAVNQQTISYHLKIDDLSVDFAALSMGNPHAVIRVADVEQAPVAVMGKFLESHPLFPERVNVGFMQILTPQHIKLRVYERGAAETMACGSGACAAVVAGIQQGWLDAKVLVSLPGGDLTIEWVGEDAVVMMTGPAEFVYDGVISSDE